MAEMVDVTNRLARTLFTLHGKRAAAIAEAAAQHVRNFNHAERVAEWERVVAAIKAIEASSGQLPTG